MSPEDIGQPDFRLGTITATRTYIQPCTDAGVAFLKMADLDALACRMVLKMSEFGMPAEDVERVAIAAHRDGLLIADGRK